MFPDYVKLVVQDYERKKSLKTLSSRLVNPSPARLRDECLLVCKENFLRKDEGILRTFFNTTGEHAQYLNTINNYDIDKFRPLVNFLRDPAIKTDVKNIDLLAWLIDFNDRPFELGKNYIVEDEKSLGATINPVENNDEDKKPDGGHILPLPPPISYNETTKSEQTSSKKNNGSLKKIGIYIGIAFLAASGMYVYYNSGNHKSAAMGTTLPFAESCMYWTGDHYEQVSCNKKIKDALVIALDSFKLVHFKKITTPDTITHQHIGRIWYIKNEGNIEFYTSEGAHPVDMKKRLKPVTGYIIDKYILSKQN